MFYLLETAGFETWLVNAKDVKHLPGRPKTDKLDAVWLCKVAERQMLWPSFVPPPPIRRLRDLTRYRPTRWPPAPPKSSGLRSCSRTHAILGNAAAGAAKTDTFLGERYRRIARRRGSKRAVVAVGRSILVIAWHLLSDPQTRFHDLGPGFYAARIDPERRKRNHIRQFETLGCKVTPRTRRLTSQAKTRLR